jgi:hypothetical protein
VLYLDKQLLLRQQIHFLQLKKIQIFLRLQNQYLQSHLSQRPLHLRRQRPQSLLRRECPDFLLCHHHHRQHG